MAPGDWVPPSCSLSLGPRPQPPLGLSHWVPSWGGVQRVGGSEEGPQRRDGQEDLGDRGKESKRENAQNMRPAEGRRQERSSLGEGRTPPLAITSQ